MNNTAAISIAIYREGDETFFAKIGGEVFSLSFIPIEAGGESVYMRNKEFVAIKNGY